MKPHRGTIFVEDEARILEHTAFDAGQFIIRVHAPKCAAAATPGSFAHVTCDPLLPMRRPLSIMRADADRGWIDILYKVHGAGLALLSGRKPGDTLSIMGPIGVGFSVRPERPRAVLIGGGVGIPPMVFLAERMSGAADGAQQPMAARPMAAPPIAARPIAFFGSEIPFPFRARPSTMLIPGIPDGVIACMPLLEGWGVPSRLASFARYPGCFDGYVTDLAAHYLQGLDPAALATTEIFACGPTLMLKAVARLAARFGLPAQVSLEEFMACAVGGCAGCAVAVQTADGTAMKRVCVDGPVFEAAAVFPQA